MATHVEPAKRRSQRTMLLLVAAVFVAPVLLAIGLYSTVELWRPQATANHGELVSPARPIEGVALEELPTGRSIDEGYLRGKWTLVYITEGECGPACQESLYRTRQVRIALNKDMGRVQRLWLTMRPVSSEDLARTRRLHPELTVALPREDTAAGLIGQFALEGGGQEAVLTAGRIYLIDPLGNLMMSYRPETDPKGLLLDLQRLLKISRIG